MRDDVGSHILHLPAVSLPGVSVVEEVDGGKTRPTVSVNLMSSWRGRLPQRQWP